MVTVSKDGPYLITGGIELIRGDADNNIIQFRAKEHQITNHFARVCTK